MELNAKFIEHLLRLYHYRYINFRLKIHQHQRGGGTEGEARRNGDPEDEAGGRGVETDELQEIRAAHDRESHVSQRRLQCLLRGAGQSGGTCSGGRGGVGKQNDRRRIRRMYSDVGKNRSCISGINFLKLSIGTDFFFNK